MSAGFQYNNNVLKSHFVVLYSSAVICPAVVSWYGTRFSKTMEAVWNNLTNLNLIDYNNQLYIK